MQWTVCDVVAKKLSRRSGYVSVEHVGSGGALKGSDTNAPAAAIYYVIVAEVQQTFF